MPSAFSDFDDTFETAQAKPQYASDQSKAVLDGKYNCEIKGGIPKETTSGKVFTFLTTIISDGPYKGYSLERTIFMFKKNGTDEEKAAYIEKRVAELKADLSKLGFDVPNWTKANGRPFGVQLDIACEMMKGLVVQMTKKTNDMANVYIDKRLPDLDGKPAKFGAEEMKAGATAAAPQNYGTSPMEMPTDDPVTPKPTTVVNDPIQW